MPELVDMKCGKCLHTYEDPAGCTFCEEAKQHMIIDDSWDFDPVGSAKRAARLMDRLLSRLETAMAKEGRKAYNTQWTKDASLISKTLASVVNEIRKVEASYAKELGEYSFEELADLMMGWFKSLPGEQRNHVLAQIVDQRPLLGDGSH